MLYLYAPHPDATVRTLAMRVGATLVRRFDGMHLWLKRDRIEFSQGDQVICWGYTLPEFEGVRMLNALLSPRNKSQRLHDLKNLGLTTIGLAAANGDIKKWKQAGYLPRVFEKCGAKDLLTPSYINPDFWCKRELFDEEFKVHVFQGTVLATGLRVLAPGFAHVEGTWKPDEGVAHPWIRTAPLGWTVEYHLPPTHPSVRDLHYLATRALSLLTLDFGVVDIGRNKWGFYVSDVDLQPDLPTADLLEHYVTSLTSWIGKDYGN